MNTKTNAAPPKPIRYEGHIPKTLKDYADRHADKIQEVCFAGGYTTESGNAYDILLRPGWRLDDDLIHTIIEPTISAALSKLRGIIPCDCDGCKRELAEAGK